MTPETTTPRTSVGEQPRLYLEFAGDEFTLEPGEPFRFGRSGDLQIDEGNRSLHRIVGAFTWRADHWWLANLGSTIALQLIDADGPSHAVIAPGHEISIGFNEFTVRFAAGRSSYEITGSGALSTETAQVDLRSSPELDDDNSTIHWGPVTLNAEQKLLLVALGQLLLRSPSAEAEVPSSRSLARQLNWTLPKLNRKLDHLCQKLDRAGVRGLRGDLGEIASARRLRLARHAIDAGLISRADLSLLGEEVVS